MLSLFNPCCFGTVGVLRALFIFISFYSGIPTKVCSLHEQPIAA